MKLARSDDPQEVRRGRWAGAVAFAAVGSTIAALIVANSAADSAITEPGAGSAVIEADRVQQLQDFHESPGTQLAATGLRGIGVLLTIAVGLYLLWLVRRRGAEVGRPVACSVVAGPVLVVAAAIVGYLAFGGVADEFAEGAQTADRAQRLIDDDGLLRAAGVFDLLARVVFALWVGVLSAQAMRRGLFTSFLGYWGIGAAGALVILPIGDAMFIGWLASVGFLALGYWPGGRPEAWDRAARMDPEPGPAT